MVGLQPAGNKGRQGRGPQVEGAVGGFRYHVGRINVRVQADCTAESTIIWRLMDESIEGDSGATLIGTRNYGGEDPHSRWELTAFKSSDLPVDTFEYPSNPFQSHYWKLAGRPYNILMRNYSALIPGKLISDLDHYLESSQDFEDISERSR